MSWAKLEANAYWTLFSVALAAVALWEMYRPWRKVSGKLLQRWRSHALLVLTSSLITMLVYRASLVMVAVGVEHRSFGILNHSRPPLAVRIALGFILLDLVSYVFHRAAHSIPILWRVHQVHHSDRDFDLSTGFRNHPLETVVQQSAYLATIVIFAPPPAAVLATQLAGMALAFFTHANAKLPAWIEKPLRSIFVTPDMHRIHHSELVREQTANYSEILSWWDRLFGSYVGVPAAGADGMRLGLEGCEDSRTENLTFMLAQPFRPLIESDPAAQPVISKAAGD